MASRTAVLGVRQRPSANCPSRCTVATGHRGRRELSHQDEYARAPENTLPFPSPRTARTADCAWGVPLAAVGSARLSGWEPTCSSSNLQLLGKLDTGTGAVTTAPKLLTHSPQCQRYSLTMKQLFSGGSRNKSKNVNKARATS